MIQHFVFATGIAAGFAAALGAVPALSQTKQEHVHVMAQTVMPFDLSKTVHFFKMTDTGGVQSVVVKDTYDKDQIRLVRRHLQHEAKAFERGDYADPMSLHGKSMPGLLQPTIKKSPSVIQNCHSVRQSRSRVGTGTWLQRSTAGLVPSYQSMDQMRGQNESQGTVERGPITCDAVVRDNFGYAVTQPWSGPLEPNRIRLLI